MGSVTIEKDGWKVSGDSEEELAIGIRAVQRALSEPEKQRDPPRKQNRAPREAREWVGRKSAQPTMMSGDERFIKNAERAVRMLKALQNNGPVCDTEPLMKAIGASSHKGFGGIMAGINRAIKECGFDVDDVYTTERLADGRKWYVQKLLDETIEELERRLRE